MRNLTKTWKSEYLTGGVCQVVFNDEITIVRFRDYSNNNILLERTFDTFFQIAELGFFIEGQSTHFWASKIIKHICDKLEQNKLRTPKF